MMGLQKMGVHFRFESGRMMWGESSPQFLVEQGSLLRDETQASFLMFVGLKGCAGDACALVAPAWVQGY